MRGGSVSSDAVTSLVSNSTYSSLSNNFTNLTSPSKCGGGAPKKKAVAKKTVAKKTVAKKTEAKPPAKKKAPRAKKGGSSDVFSTVSNAVKSAISSTFNRGSQSEGFNVFRSSPALAGAEYANLRGSQVAKGGFAGQNLSNYMSNTNNYNVRNKKGGASVGLDYSNIQHTSKMHGDVVPRATHESVNRLMATDSISSTPAMNKIALFGSTSDVAHKFNYAGVSPVVKAPSGGKCGCRKSRKK